jgi:hypothetical protein
MPSSNARTTVVGLLLAFFSIPCVSGGMRSENCSGVIRVIREDLAGISGGPNVVEAALKTLPSGHLPADYLTLTEKQLLDCRTQIEPLLLDSSLDPVGSALILGFFKSERALPVLRKNLLTQRYFYGWEGPDYSKESSWLADNQYPHHEAWIVAIEAITGRPIAEAIHLTETERKRLQKEAAQARPMSEDGEMTEEAYCAKWLLQKFEVAQ